MALNTTISRIFPLVLLLILSACSASSQLVKRAQTLEAEKNYRDAVNVYNEALIRKPNNRDARAGLQRTGQIVLDDMLSEFWQHYNLEEYETAIKKYEEARAFERQVSLHQIRLEWAPHYNQYFKTAQENQLKNWFQDAAKAIDNQDYRKAESLLRRIERQNPNYQGLDQMRQAIEIDPLYQKALTAYSIGSTGEAVSFFSQVAAVNPDYRDTREILAKLKANSSLSIAILPIEDKSGTPNVASELSTEIVNQLLALRNPLIRLIDREYMNKILEEQKLGLSGLIDESSAARAGRLMGGNAVLVGTVTEIKIDNRAPQKESRTAFTRERVYYRDSWSGSQMSQFQYREQTYYEVTQERKVTLTFKYRLIDVESGTILDSDVITRSAINTVRYAESRTSPDQLYPRAGNVSQSDLTRWRQRFFADKSMKSSAQLLNLVEEDVSREVARKVNANGFLQLR